LMSVGWIRFRPSGVMETSARISNGRVKKPDRRPAGLSPFF
jgi:hypothetical protein